MIVLYSSCACACARTHNFERILNIPANLLFYSVNVGGLLSDSWSFILASLTLRLLSAARTAECFHFVYVYQESVVAVCLM